MEITKNIELRKEVLDNIRQTITGHEREGIHLSDLIYCSRKFLIRRAGLAPEPSDEQCMLFMTGFAFQAFMFPKDDEIPYIYDNIICTPDIPTGIEVKSTRRSMGKFSVWDMQHWQKQILGYCKALDKLEYDLVVLFVCGDYKPPFPNMDCWHIQATQEEVNANWAEITARRDKLLAFITSTDSVGITDVEPDCADWEWEFCENWRYCPDTTCYQKRRLKELKTK